MPDPFKCDTVPCHSSKDQAVVRTSPASSGRGSKPGSTPVGTTGQPAAGTAALRETFTLSNVPEIIRKFGGADRFRNAVNQLQTLPHAT